MLSDSEKQLKDDINEWDKNEQDENTEIEKNVIKPMHRCPPMQMPVGVV